MKNNYNKFYYISFYYIAFFLVVLSFEHAFIYALNHNINDLIEQTNNNYQEKYRCPICYEYEQEDTIFITLPCFSSHIFHKSCLHTYITNNYKNSPTFQCPLCRKNISCFCILPSGFFSFTEITDIFLYNMPLYFNRIITHTTQKNKLLKFSFALLTGKDITKNDLSLIFDQNLYDIFSYQHTYYYALFCAYLIKTDSSFTDLLNTLTANFYYHKTHEEHLFQAIYLILQQRHHTMPELKYTIREFLGLFYWLLYIKSTKDSQAKEALNIISQLVEQNSEKTLENLTITALKNFFHSTIDTIIAFMQTQIPLSENSHAFDILTMLPWNILPNQIHTKYPKKFLNIINIHLEKILKEVSKSNKNLLDDLAQQIILNKHISYTQFMPEFSAIQESFNTALQNLHIHDRALSNFNNERIKIVGMWLFFLTFFYQLVFLSAPYDHIYTHQ